MVISMSHAKEAKASQYIRYITFDSSQVYGTLLITIPRFNMHNDKHSSLQNKGNKLKDKINNYQHMV